MVDDMPVSNASRTVRARQEQDSASKSSDVTDTQTDETSSVDSTGSLQSEAHRSTTTSEREGGEAGPDTRNPSPEEHTDEVRSEINAPDERGGTAGN